MQLKFAHSDKIRKLIFNQTKWNFKKAIKYVTNSSKLKQKNPKKMWIL